MAIAITRQEANQLSLDHYTYKDKANVFLDKCYTEIRNAATLGKTETIISWDENNLNPFPEASLNITMSTLGDLGFEVYVINKSNVPYPYPEKQISVKWSDPILEILGGDTD